MKPLTAQVLQQKHGLSKSMFWELVHRNNIPYVRFSRKCIRFKQEGVDALEKLVEAKTVRGLDDLRKIVRQERRHANA